MSELTYIKCDGCGSVHPASAEEWPQTRMKDGWGTIGTYVKQYDLCAECLVKALKAVGMNERKRACK